MAKFLLLLVCLPAFAADTPVFPIPREIHTTGTTFHIDDGVTIAGDAKTGRLLMAEFSERYGAAVPLGAAGKRTIVMGPIADPLVRQTASRLGVRISSGDPGAEGYAIEIRPDIVLVAGCDDAGAFYGFETLRQLVRRRGSAVEIAGASIRDWPYKPFRGIKMYLPGRNNLPYFRRFLTEFMAANKFNKLILELNAAMRFDRHPELNAGWLDLARDLDATRRDRPQGPHNNANSSHQDTADGGILEKDEVAAIVRLAAENHIEVIPEIASLSHSYYLLSRHKELAEIPGQQWPDTYCPSLAASYRLLFDVMDEYLDVMKPRMVHIGKDEWRMPWGLCPRCAKRDYREVFIEDVRKIYDHLHERGIQAAMWGDYLIQPLRGYDLVQKTGVNGWKYMTPGAITPEQARTRIPKDILMFNWFWNDAGAGQGEKDDLLLAEWGFRQVYGNMTTGIQNYGRRSARQSVIGGAPSSWAATTEFNFGKDLLFDFLGCGNMLWSTSWPDEAGLASIVQDRVEWYRPRLRSAVPPSDLDPVTPVRLPGGAPEAVPAGEMRTGRIGKFEVSAPIAVGVKVTGDVDHPLESAPIPINEDASSILFLHATARAARNNQAYRYIYNFDDSADLVGWYEIVYTDGFVETVPLRHRVNILDWGRMRRRGGDYCYGADAVDLSTDPAKPVAFYAFEWRNPRLGKVIKEVRLKGSNGFRQGTRPIPSNTILLAGVSVVKKRAFPATVVP